MLRFSVLNEGQENQCIDVDVDGVKHTIPIPTVALPTDQQERFTYLTQKMMDAKVVPVGSFVLNI